MNEFTKRINDLRDQIEALTAYPVIDEKQRKKVTNKVIFIRDAINYLKLSPGKESIENNIHKLLDKIKTRQELKDDLLKPQYHFSETKKKEIIKSLSVTEMLNQIKFLRYCLSDSDNQETETE